MDQLSPEILAQYLDVLRGQRVKAACLKLGEHLELRVDFEPEVAEWPTEPPAPEPEPGGWKRVA